MTENTFNQIKSAYLRMSEQARYRPAAPSDGFGNITVPLEKLDLEVEAALYAKKWWSDEDAMQHWTGTCNFSTRPASIFAIEAVRNLCAGDGGNETALRLLKMAVKELERETA